MKKIDMADLVEGEVYRIRSRNLVVGVWVPEVGGFIGVRNKFGDDYLFTEYHYDFDTHVGTVTSMVPLNIRVPEWIGLKEAYFLCKTCRAPVKWTEGGYKHILTSPAHEAEAEYVANGDLFDFLKPISDAVYAVIEAERKQEDLDRESLRWAPQTYRDHAYEIEKAKADAWRREQMDGGRTFRDVVDEWHERLKEARRIADGAVPPGGN